MSFDNSLKYAFVNYSLIAIPLAILVVIKLLSGKFIDLILTGDWSIASAMMFSASFVNVKSAIDESTERFSNEPVSYFYAKCISFTCLNVSVYTLSLLQPSITVGICQIVIFIISSILFLKYCRLAYMIRHQN